jgi:hypothetical protein
MRRFSGSARWGRPTTALIWPKFPKLVRVGTSSVTYRAPPAIRNPNAEGSSKAELQTRSALDFGNSGFGFLSEFGLRISERYVTELAPLSN